MVNDGNVPFHTNSKATQSKACSSQLSACRPKRTLCDFSLQSLLSQDVGNHHLQIRRPQRSRQQRRPQPGPPQPGAPQPGPPLQPQAPQPGPQPPGQRRRPQRSRQQRPHCTSVMLSMPEVAAAGSGRIGADWAIPEPPAKTRPAIPAANSMRNMCVHPTFPWLICSSSR